MAPTIPVTRKDNLLPAAAWGLMLLASILPEIVLYELLQRPDLLPWITWGRLLALAGLTAVSRFWPPLRPLWNYPAILFLFLAAQLGLTALQDSPFWPTLTWIDNPTTRDLFDVQLWKLGVTAVVLAGLFALGYTREQAYLVRGRLDAPAAPARWLGFPRPEPWTHFGTKWILFLGLGTAVLLFLFGPVRIPGLSGALASLPAILLLSALNAFNEEVTYRSAQLAPLEPAVGPRQALWIVAVLFAISHYYSAINGIPGVLLTIFMGWMLTKAMLETRGFFWPWLIHFTQDVIIFWFIFGGSTRLN